jgi:CRP-like cAMP-binding protein
MSERVSREKVTVEQLAQFQLFSKLKTEELESLIYLLETEKYKEGDFVFKELEDGNSMFLIISGSVDIRKTIDEEKGTDKSLAILPSGEFFGEMSLLTGENRSASVRVVEDSTLVKISRRKFISLMSKNPKMAALLLGGLVSFISKRLRATSLEAVTLYETGRIISNTKDVVELSEKILDQLMKSTNSESGMILFWNEIVECFEVQVAQNYELDTQIDMSAFAGTSEFSQFLLGLSEPFVPKSEEQFETMKTVGFCCDGLAFVPLITDYSDPNLDYQYVKRVSGIIVLGHSNGEHFTLSNLIMLKGVADQVAQAMLNAKLLQENESRRAYEQVYVTPGF